jgi:branched-chain amino acid transport system substrate-binding protein
METRNATIACAALFAALSAGSSAGADPVKLGIPLPLSGNAAAWGQQARAALKVAQDEIKSVGGLPIEFVIKDDASSPNESVVVTRQMITADKVAVILGPFLSSAAQTTIPLAKREQTPFVEPSAAVPKLLEPARPFAVRIALINQDANRGPFEAWLKQRKIKKIAVGFENSNPATKDAGGRQYVEGARAAGVDVVNADSPVTWTVDMTDFSAVVTRLRGYGDIDAVALANGNEAPLMAKEMQRQGIKIPVWTGNIFGDDQSLITRAGDSVEGWIGVSQNWSGDPKVQDFVTKFRAKLKEDTSKDENPNTYAFNYYYAARATAEIVQKAGLNADSSLAQIRKAVTDGWNGLKGYKTPQGEISIGSDGEANRPLFILEVKGGKWVMDQVYQSQSQSQ